MKEIINKYKLEPHPEGGYYREIYRSEQKIYSPFAKSQRSSVTHIYFLLLKGQISRFHKVLHDEIWNFYEGDPIKLITLNNEEIQQSTIGKNTESYNFIVKGGAFQAAETTGEYSLVGCSVAPGFDFKDFTFLKDDEQSTEKLKNKYPEYIKYL